MPTFPHQIPSPHEESDEPLQSEPPSPEDQQPEDTDPFLASDSRASNRTNVAHLSPLGRWLQEGPRDAPYDVIDFSGGVERRGQRPPDPDLPPRLAAQQNVGPSGTSRDDDPRCRLCGARVCLPQSANRIHHPLN